MSKLQIRNSFLLFLTAFIWGTAFVAQSVGMDHIGPFTFSVIRSFLGSVFLVPCILVLDRKKDAGGKREAGTQEKKDLLLGGTLCGVVLFAASNLQQFAMLYTSVGKSGFLTALYIVIVPVFGIFAGKKPGGRLWLAVGLAVAGLYLLCMKSGSFGLGIGEILLLLAAAVFSLHIMVIDHFTQKADGVKMSCIQFLVCGCLSAVGMLLFESVSFSAVLLSMGPLLYTGILSSGVGYTLQIVGQKGMNPVVASLIMSLESVISAIAGWVILGQRLSGREILGCVIMFAAIILAQLPKNPGKKG